MLMCAKQTVMGGTAFLIYYVGGSFCRGTERKGLGICQFIYASVCIQLNVPGSLGQKSKIILVLSKSLLTVFYTCTVFVCMLFSCTIALFHLRGNMKQSLSL